jgi:hypothetical protein
MILLSSPYSDFNTLLLFILSPDYCDARDSAYPGQFPNARVLLVNKKAASPLEKTARLMPSFYNMILFNVSGNKKGHPVTRNGQIHFRCFRLYQLVYITPFLLYLKVVTLIKIVATEPTKFCL